MDCISSDGSGHATEPWIEERERFGEVGQVDQKNTIGHRCTFGLCFFLQHVVCHCTKTCPQSADALSLALCELPFMHVYAGMYLKQGMISTAGSWEFRGSTHVRQ